LDLKIRVSELFPKKNKERKRTSPYWKLIKEKERGGEKTLSGVCLGEIREKETRIGKETRWLRCIYGGVYGGLIWEWGFFNF
jgi:hypothetical protein